MIHRLSFVAPPETLTLDAEREGAIRFRVRAAEDAEVDLRVEIEQDTVGTPTSRDWPDVRVFADGKPVSWSRRASWTWVGAPDSGRALRIEKSTKPTKVPDDRELGIAVKVEAPEGFSGRIRLLLGDGPRGWTASPWVDHVPAARDRIKRLLPGSYQAAVEQRPQGAVAALIEATHGMLAPVDRRIRALPETLSANGAPDDFVPLLAGWLATGATSRDALPPNREWLRRATEIAQSRGTARGLVLTLEVATGVQGFTVDEGVDDFHLTVSAPLHLRGLEGALRSLIDRQRPAHMTYSLEFAAPPPPPSP